VLGGGRRSTVFQTMYKHVNNCKSCKIKERKNSSFTRYIMQFSKKLNTEENKCFENENNYIKHI
jgi:hypothetical protein